ncbi:hypothetical protein JCM10213v2_001513 [Rhodosporidiobolus nylandii]
MDDALASTSLPVPPLSPPSLTAPTASPSAPPSHPLDATLDDDNLEVGDEAQRRRTSIYVQAADEMLTTVLSREGFLFNSHEKGALERWHGLEYQARYLFMRLFLRKHGQWIRVSSLRASYTSSSSSSSSPATGPKREASRTPAFDIEGEGGEDPLAPVEEEGGKGGKKDWPPDITDLDAACEALWARVEPEPGGDEGVKEEGEDEGGKPPASPSPSSSLPTAVAVAGPSTPPRPRPCTPPPPPPARSHTPAKGKENAQPAGFLDLTLSSDDEAAESKPAVLDLTFSPVRPTPKSAKARGKQRAVPPAPRGAPSSFPAPAALTTSHATPGAAGSAATAPPPPAPPDPEEPDYTTFALSASTLALAPPQEVLAILTLDELKEMARRMKVKVGQGGRGATRADYTAALLRTSSQSTLSFFASPAPPSVAPPPTSKGAKGGPSTPMRRTSSGTGTVGVGYDAKGRKLTQSGVVVRQALAAIGPVIRLPPPILSLFARLSLVYHRTSYTSLSTSSLTSSLLARFGKRRYPSYAVSRSFSIFPSRERLIEFERAVGREREVEECLDGAWAAGTAPRGKKGAEREGKEDRLERYRKGVRLWEEEGTERKWMALCEEAEREMAVKKDEEDEAGERLLYYRRRFHPGWPLSRAAYKAAGCYAKLNLHPLEASLLRHLLSQTSFRRGKRGDWYDRLALVLMKYPGTGEGALSRSLASSAAGAKEDEGVKDEEAEEQKPANAKGKKPVRKPGKASKGKVKKAKGRAKKEEDLDDGDEEMLDADVKVKPDDDDAEEEEGEKEREKRERLEEALRVCEAGLRDPFTHLIYKSSLHRRIARLYSALQLGPPPTPTEILEKPKQRVMEGERVDVPTVGKKSVWRLSDGAEGTVEELCLEQYVREGWKGFHSENGVLTMIFALTFWDIIFSPIDGVFETPYQSAPLDLATDAFAVVRRPAITARLASIAGGGAVQLLSETDDRERPLGTWAVGTNWERFSKEDLVEIVECMGGPALAAILTVFVEEYGHRTGGIPDLCLWNPSTHRVLFAEIKGPGDTLSETQKVWLDVLLSASAASGGSVSVEVTRVVASREGPATESHDDDDKDDGSGGKKRKGRGRSRSSAAPKKRAKTEEVLELDSD